MLNGWHGIITGAGILRMPRSKYCPALKRKFIFIAACIDRSVERKSSMPTVRLHTHLVELIQGLLYWKNTVQKSIRCSFVDV